MSEPRTEAGRAHLKWLLAGDDVFEEDARAAVLAIEAEAAARPSDDLTGLRLRTLHYRLTEASRHLTAGDIHAAHIQIAGMLDELPRAELEAALAAEGSGE